MVDEKQEINFSFSLVRPPLYIQVMTVMLVHSSSYGVFQAATATLGTLIRRHSELTLSIFLSYFLIIFFCYSTYYVGINNNNNWGYENISAVNIPVLGKFT